MTGKKKLKAKNVDVICTVILNISEILETPVGLSVVAFGSASC